SRSCWTHFLTSFTILPSSTHSPARIDSTKQAPATNTPCLEPDLPEVLYLLIARITSFCHFNASCTNHPDNDDKPPSVSRYSFCKDRKSTRLNSSHVSISYAV